MPQFNLTEEDTTITRADIATMLANRPNGKTRESHIRQQLNGKMDKESIDKVVSDLNSY